MLHDLADGDLRELTPAVTTARLTNNEQPKGKDSGETSVSGAPDAAAIVSNKRTNMSLRLRFSVKVSPLACVELASRSALSRFRPKRFFHSLSTGDNGSSASSIAASSSISLPLPRAPLTRIRGDWATFETYRTT